MVHPSRIVETLPIRHILPMSEEPDTFEQAARIVEAFSEGEDDQRVIDLLAQIAIAIRERAFND